MGQTRKTEKPDVWGCTLRQVAPEHRVEAARVAIEHNPANHPDPHIAAALAPAEGPHPEFIAMMTSKYWGVNGVRLTVGFLDTPPADLRRRIVAHMNAWNRTANVNFAEVASDPEHADVRITRGPTGHWSYLGTDIRLIPAGQPTMNLQDFTMQTPDSEFFRVVRHETGHTLGSPHEHMRQELVNLIDPDKAFRYFGATQGWDPDQVRRQVLTPLEASSITASAPDQYSIMCYQIPPSITRSGKPIPGGTDIDQVDYDFMAIMYPKPKQTAPAAPAAVGGDAGMAPGRTAGAPAAAGAGLRGEASHAHRHGLVELVRGDLKAHLHHPVDTETLRELIRAFG